MNNNAEITDFDVEENVPLRTCRFCERKFNPTSIERHEKICEKSKKCNRRTVFNSFLQRSKEIAAEPVPKDKSNNNIRIKRKQEQNVIGSVKSNQLLNNGMTLQRSLQPGLQQCPHCERCFSSKAADRHITWCREQKSRLPKTPPDALALHRLQARVKYRAPPPGRLAKSAESVRESSHATPRPSPQRLSEVPLLRQKNRTHPVNCVDTSSKTDKPLVTTCDRKHKEHVMSKDAWQKERTKSLDMLAALRARLSELRTSDDFIEDFILDPGRRNDDATDLSAPGRTARFCYNCGTRYPVAAAKFCCECGSRRLVLDVDEDQLYFP